MRLKVAAASLLAVLATMAALPSTGAAAQEDFTNTEHLLKWCKQPETSSNHAYCVGFILGVGNMMAMVGASAPSDFRVTMGICAPEPGPSPNAAVQVFINWAEKNPKYWGQSNIVGVTLALQQTWPCTPDAKPPS